jgi:glutaredoxin
MSTQVVVYTMKGCPYCVELKELLVKENIEFVDRDIDEHEEEYDVFTKVVENDYIPALLIIKEGGEKLQSFLYAPERDYNELTEAIDLVKKHLI